MCKIEGCQLPNNHYNPLVFPFISYHGRVLRTFDSLPEKGKVFEVAKRVGFVVVAPLAYLVLGLTALVGLTLDRFFVKGHQKSEDVDDIEEEPIREHEPDPLQGIDKLYELFGGREEFERIPVLEGWDGTLDANLMTSTIMRYDHPNSTYIFFLINKPVIDVETGQPGGRTRDAMDCLQWFKHSESIKVVYRNNSQIVFNASDNVASGSMLEDVIFDRIKRLMNGEFVGYAKMYSRIVLKKPENHDDFRPDDAYLEGEDLERFMDENTVYYEVAEGAGGNLNAIQLVRT